MRPIHRAKKWQLATCGAGVGNRSGYPIWPEGFALYLKPEARIAPFLDGTIETEGIVTFTETYVEFRHDKKEIKVPYDSIAFIINE